MLVPISPGDIVKLAQVVREETGNQVVEKNFSMLESRIRSHLLKLGIKSMSDYWEHFRLNEVAERAIIQGLMTTHYTFFFREFAHFEAVERWIEQEAPRLKARYFANKQPVRIWSAACSRGQEIYSLAIFLEINLLKKQGIPFELIGTDIDAESVSYAKNGVYAIKEVNTIPQVYLKGFWRRGTGSIQDFAAVHPSIKEKARFESLNLLELPKWSNTYKFDVIFCRNVFIYFSEDNVRKISLDLVQRLDPKGLFISGMSEPLRFKEWDLVSVGPSCYRRAAAVEANTALTVTGHSLAARAPSTVSERITERYRVLCVDDSKTIQTLIKNIFAQDPACERVEFALNGREAREKLDAGKYDLITLDIHMPEVNGIEFLEHLYKRRSDPPVLMVSSVNRTDLELATKSLSLGAFDYVEKPAMNNLQKSTDEILTKTKMALRHRHVQEPIEVSSVSGFDASISQKIVVPDASQCLRIIAASEDCTLQLEQILRGQRGEYRSPALLICWRNTPDAPPIEAQILKWTDRQIVLLRDETLPMKPKCL
ncbi:MAG: response regulator [Proteobacteria bacterium]|nr:MAG: response regulator [Pseudomonadota bacterium]